MKAHRFLPALIFTAAFLAACGNNAPTENEKFRVQVSTGTAAVAQPADVAMKASSLISGKITDVSKTPDADGIWTVKIATADGRMISIRYDAAVELLDIRGAFSPANFEFKPGAYFVPLSMIAMVVEHDRKAEILEWRFERNQSNGEWVYRLRIRSLSGESRNITMSAVSRRILEDEPA